MMKQTGRQTYRQPDRNRQTDHRHTVETERDRQIDVGADRYRLTGVRTYRQTDRQTVTGKVQCKDRTNSNPTKT